MLLHMIIIIIFAYPVVGIWHFCWKMRHDSAWSLVAALVLVFAFILSFAWFTELDLRILSGSLGGGGVLLMVLGSSLLVKVLLLAANLLSTVLHLLTKSHDNAILVLPS